MRRRWRPKPPPGGEQRTHLCFVQKCTLCYFRSCGCSRAPHTQQLHTTCIVHDDGGSSGRGFSCLSHKSCTGIQWRGKKSSIALTTVQNAWLYSACHGDTVLTAAWGVQISYLCIRSCLWNSECSCSRKNRFRPEEEEKVAVWVTELSHEPTSEILCEEFCACVPKALVAGRKWFFYRFKTCPVF